MEELNVIVGRLKEIDARQASIEAEADEKNNGVFTDEQRAEYDQLSAEYGEKKARKEAIEDDLKKRSGRADRASDFQIANFPRRTAAAAGNAPPAEVTEPAKRPKVPATARVSGRVRNFQGDINGRTPEERAYDFGMLALAGLASAIPNRYRFPEATSYVQQYMTSPHKRVDDNGTSAVILEEFSRDIIANIEEHGVARRVLKVEPVRGESKSIPRRRGGLTAYFVAEAAPIPESSKLWDNIRLTPKKLAVISRWTHEVDADSVINFGDDLIGEIALAFAEKEDRCAFLGDGSSTYGGMIGINTKLQDVDGAGTDSAGLVTASGNAMSEFTLANWLAVIAKLPQWSNNRNTVWVMHNAAYYNAALPLVLAAGGSPGSDIRNGDRDRRPVFLGFPVEFSNVYPSSDANSQVVATLGDHTKGAIFGDRQRQEITFSEHATVDGENVFERDEIAIRGTERFDIVVHDVGTSTTPGAIVGLQSAGS